MEEDTFADINLQTEKLLMFIENYALCLLLNSSELFVIQFNT